MTEASGAAQELQLLIQSLTRKVGESEERYSLLQEQTESLKELLLTEKEQYTQKENMYKQNVCFHRVQANGNVSEVECDLNQVNTFVFRSRRLKTSLSRRTTS